VLPFPTLIRGGSGINVVPSSCEAYGDVRLLPGTSPEEIKRLITERLERFSIPNSQLDDLLEVPAAETHPQAEVVQTQPAAVAVITGTQPRVEGSGPACAMRIFSALNTTGTNISRENACKMLKIELLRKKIAGCEA
jgi:acetylornithine deacetylase/succinyl-diaminopimelate desuccinylase-like protein